MHLLVACVVAAIVAAVIGGFWFVELHPRISQSSLENDVAVRTGARAVRCFSDKRNGSVWTCGVVYGAESVCELANVSVLGSWRTATADPKHCTAIASLVALAPKITASGVRDAIEHDYGDSITACQPVAAHPNRWLCVGQASSGATCTNVRAVAWAQFAPSPERLAVCQRVPKLRRYLART
jgi:hypothetical protein